MPSFENIITRSAARTNVLRNVEPVASSDATVLNFGESGTDKELIARTIHSLRPCGNRPLVRVNCSALPANHWPGNVRALENLIERAVIISPGPKLVLGE
ncbi:MAG: Anaerobic nitric oxide reductase transcription regulator NorR [bacterium]|nr:Anaerobic nitric oxide reductase transcription regulator NorR [bacterium]